MFYFAATSIVVHMANMFSSNMLYDLDDSICFFGKNMKIKQSLAFLCVKYNPY